MTDSTPEPRLATTTTGGRCSAIWTAVVAREISSRRGQLTEESRASVRDVSVIKAAGRIEIGDEEAINSTLPEPTRAATTAEHLLCEYLRDTGQTEPTVTVESSPSNGSLNGGSRVNPCCRGTQIVYSRYGSMRGPHLKNN